MASLSLIYYYIVWHYSLAFVDITRVWRNMVWFVYNFFSIQLLLRSLFAPWERLGEEYKKGFDIGSFLSTFTINIVMRGVGVVLRLSAICAGVVSLLIALVVGILGYIVWFFIPVIVLVAFVSGISMLI